MIKNIIRPTNLSPVYTFSIILPIFKHYLYFIFSQTYPQDIFTLHICQFTLHLSSTKHGIHNTLRKKRVFSQTTYTYSVHDAYCHRRHTIFPTNMHSTGFYKMNVFSSHKKECRITDTLSTKSIYRSNHLSITPE